MFRVMIVEDEIHILNYMKKKLSEYEIFKVEATFSSPEEALSSFEAIQPDVVFLDIEMPRINGIDLARRLLDKKYDLQIVFTTAYGQYALEAFEVEAIDYLMKPIVSDDILRVIKRLKKVIDIKSSHKITEGKVGEPKVVDTNKKVVESICCFGNFHLVDCNGQLVKWPTRKAEELFAYFLINQRKYISKWELLELFWDDMDEERGLHNLYNTIYRIKQVLKNLYKSPTIRKINDGYILESEEVLSDLDKFYMIMGNLKAINGDSIEEVLSIYFSYTTPLFGSRDYFWSIPTQEYLARLYAKLCEQLLSYFREVNDFERAEEVIGHYVINHIEDEAMITKWLKTLQGWSGYEEKAIEHKYWINKKLQEADLPILQ